MTGQLTYTIPGSYSFVCPPDVTSVSVVCIGGGGQSGNSRGSNSNGGGGGGLGYKNNIEVVPGNTYTVVVGDGGKSSGIYGNGSDGGDSYFKNNTTVAGLGGKGGDLYGNPGTGGAYVGDGGGNGGAGGAANSLQGGGGGAGGYSGNGGDGLSSASGSSGAGTGGAGGGGYKAGGGGVGLLGEGSSGASASSGTIGNAGSNGEDGEVPTQTFPYVNNAGVSTSITYPRHSRDGGSYGGGGGSCGATGCGAAGAVRIIWPGTSRSFPSTGIADAGIGTATPTPQHFSNQNDELLFIRIKDGSTFQHPILKYNFELSFPGAIDNLDSSLYQHFRRNMRPPLDVYGENQHVEYRNYQEYTSLNIDQPVTAVQCPINAHIEGVTSGALGVAQTGATGTEIRVFDTTGTFWNNEQIKFTSLDNTQITRTTTSVGVGTTALFGTGGWWYNTDMTIASGGHVDTYEDFWCYDIMDASEVTSKQNQTKDNWNSGIGTLLGSWTFDEVTCSFKAPLPIPIASSVGIITNAALYDNVTGDYVGIGSTTLSGSVSLSYSWDEAAYQADNTKGWVAD